MLTKEEAEAPQPVDEEKYEPSNVIIVRVWYQVKNTKANKVEFWE